MRKYLIDTQKVFVSYPSSDDEGGRKIILNDINLQVQTGELLTVVGPSGCGKSTLLRLILGSQFPSSGKALVDDKQVCRVTRDCGIVFQNYSLFPHLTVEENVAAGPILEHTNMLQWFLNRPILGATQVVDQYVLGPAIDLFGKLFRRQVVPVQSPAALRDVATKAGQTPAPPGRSAATASPVQDSACLQSSAAMAPVPVEIPTGYTRPKRLQKLLERLRYFGVLKDARARARELLAQCGLDPVEHGRKYPRELSGGMKQRVAIAQSLIMEPKILLMDEPFGALDQQTREDMQDLIHQQWAKHGITIFFVTHDLPEACKLGTRLIALSQFWTDENGHPGKGAKILIDKKIAGGAELPSKFQNSEEFKDLIGDITHRALTKSNPQSISAFELTHEDAFKPGKEPIVNVGK